MKKIMWGISMLSLVLTAVMLQFMPDTVPMHSNFEGEIDRWGSKYENLIFPVIIFLLALFWHLFITHFEKKASKAGTEKERAELLSNVKVLGIVGIMSVGVNIVIEGVSMYSKCVNAGSDASNSNIDIMKITCILLGVLFIVLGNFMPKTRKNTAVGVRIKWSMYNDTTWMKSNRFGAIAMIIAGLLSVGTTIFTKALTAIILMTVYLLAAVTAIFIYSYRVYKKELAGQNN